MSEVSDSDSPVVWLSMLEHYAYCPRQCALIHLEQTYEENRFTIRGSLFHEKAHEKLSTVERGMKVERGMPLWSDQFGIRGISDVVEFPDGIPFPVEYKAGKRMKALFKTAAHVQLCGQALCLEEMFETSVGEGALFFKQSQRRQQVPITRELRELTTKIIREIGVMLEKQILPRPLNDNHCPNCSLIKSCIPELANKTVQNVYNQLIMDD